jgi:hypothetical protein
VADRTLAIRAGLVAGTLVLGGIAYVLGVRLVEDRTGVSTNPSPTASPQVSTRDWVRFEDENAGMTVSYPRDWTKLEDNSATELNPADVDDPQNVRLIAGPSRTEPYLLMRAIPLPAEIVLPPDITAEFLGTVQGQLDELIEGPDVRVADKRPTNHKGKLAWRYLYNFKDQATGREGSHVHYFIFDGAKINVLVFQALPAGDLAQLAPTFDRVLENFESETRIIPRTVVSLPPSPSPSPSP